MTILPKKKQPKERQDIRTQLTSGSETAGQGASSSSRPSFYGQSSETCETLRKKHKSEWTRSKKCISTCPASPKEGPNSGDENDGPVFVDEQLEHRFEERLRKSKGFTIKKMRGDGACLFRAFADQIYGDEEMHGTVRKLCMDYMAKNVDYFSQFVTEDIHDYISRKRQEHEHGNHVEMQAIAEIFSRPIEVYEYSTEPINTFQPDGGKDNPPLRLSYHGTVHYNSVVDPYGATIGVGLGLPGLLPGSAEKTLMRDALRLSEAHEIEQTMLNDKMTLSDWQATERQCSEQVQIWGNYRSKAARESYLQWMREKERHFKERNVPCYSGSLNNAESSGSINDQSKRPQNHPNMQIAGSLPTFVDNVLPVRDFGLTDWGDESEVLAQVLALSEKEYLECLKPKESTKKDVNEKPSSSNTR